MYRKIDIKAQFVGYLIFAWIFDYDIDAMIKESKRRVKKFGKKHKEDLEFAQWLKIELKKDSNLLDRIKKMANEVNSKDGMIGYG